MHAVAEQLRSEEDPREFLRDLMKKKKELVTWFASTCGRTEGSKKRMDLVEKLVGMGLNVDRRLVEIIVLFFNLCIKVYHEFNLDNEI